MKNFFTPKSDILRFLVKFQKVGGTLVLVTVTVTGQTDNFSDGDQNYTIILSQDNQTTDKKFRYVDPPDVSLKNLDLTGKGGYYVSIRKNS